MNYVSGFILRRVSYEKMDEEHVSKQASRFAFYNFIYFIIFLCYGALVLCGILSINECLLHNHYSSGLFVLFLGDPLLYGTSS